jgi:DNA-binding transcriptional LysR family regulator
MRLDEISVFVAVVHAGSFIGAARRLGAPPSTISARVIALEQRLGVTLIQRTTRKLRTTDAGQRYFEDCRKALRQLEIADELVTEATRGDSGVLRLTAASDVAQSALPPVIAGFRAAYPRMKIDLVVTDQFVDMIADGIDLAVRPGPMRDSNLIVRTFITASPGLYASAAYLKRRGTPQRIEDLDRHDIVGFSRMPGKLEMRRAGRRVDLSFEGMIASDDMMTVRALVERDLGIGFLPGFLAEQAMSPLVRVLPQLSHRISGLYFAYPAQRFVPLRVRRFIDFAAQQQRRRPSNSK